MVASMAGGAQSLCGWDYANQRVVGLGESPSIWLLRVGDAQRGLSPSQCLSFPREPPGPGKAELQKCHPEIQSHREPFMARPGQDRAAGAWLPPRPQGPPSRGSLTLSPSPHPPTHPPSAPGARGNGGDRTPRCHCPLWHGRAEPPAQGHRGGLGRGSWSEPRRPCGPAPLLPRSPQNEVSTPGADGVQEAPQGQGGLWDSFVPGGLQESNGTPQMWGDPGPWGAAPSSAGEGAVTGGPGTRPGIGGHPGGHSPIPAP